MKGDRPNIYPVEDLPDKPDILERPSLEIPSTPRNSPIITTQSTAPKYDSGSLESLALSTDPDTPIRPKYTPIGKRPVVSGATFTSKTSQHDTPIEEPDPDPRQYPDRPFTFGMNTVVNGSSFSHYNIGDNSQVFMFQSAQALSNDPHAPIASPIRGFHAWDQSEKINALTAVHSLRTITRAATESHSASLHASLSSYMEFVNYLVESKLSERAGSLQARAICLVVLAGVATFLGVVQLLTLILMAGLDVMPTGRNNSDTVGKVVNIFAFCGVSLDALGAMFALWTFRSLILTISKIEKIVFEKQNINAKIHFTLDTFREAESPPQQRQTIKTKTARVFGVNQDIQSPSMNLVNLFADFQQSSAKYHMEAREVVHLIDDHLPVQEDCITLAIIAAGLIFFFVSLFSFIISAQPLSVWVSTTVVVAVTFIILRINISHQQPGSWRSIMWRVRTTITKCFPLKNTRASGEAIDDDDVLVFR